MRAAVSTLAIRNFLMMDIPQQWLFWLGARRAHDVAPAFVFRLEEAFEILGCAPHCLTTLFLKSLDHLGIAQRPIDFGVQLLDHGSRDAHGRDHPFPVTRLEAGVA